MDGSKQVMEILDSLWFFNNVLTSPTFEQKDQAAVLHEDTVKEEESAKQKNILEAEAPSNEILVPRCPKCGVGIEQKIVQHQPVKELEFPTPESHGRRRRSRRKRSKKKAFGELDLGFHGNLASWFSEETYGYPNFGTQDYMKMPPLNDGLAMKEHLKSWAYAVAKVTTTNYLLQVRT
ncbi:hypothetical protein PTKIN_Ptkin01aG0102200 [Pterospermum kingtungense]